MASASDAGQTDIPPASICGRLMMADDRLPMLPWFPADFMAATRGWSVTTRGVYRELLDAQWSMGRLPRDPDMLKRLIGARDDEWQEAWPYVETKFPVTQGRCRANVRLEYHRSRTIDLKQKAKKGADITNLKRYGKSSPSERTATRPALASSIRSDLQSDLQSDPSQKEAPIFTLSSDSNGSGAAEPPASCPEFEAYRRIFPKRSGEHRWETAKRAAVNLVKRRIYSWQQILDAAQRYRDKCDRECITGLSIVMQAATFVGREHKENIASAWAPEPTRGDRKVAENISESQKWLEQRRAQRAGH